MKQLILASGSVYRRELLSRLGVEFAVCSPDVDERAVDLPPRELASHLAHAKAAAVAERFPEAVIIGSDQVPSLDDQILTKPGTPERAVEQLMRLRGREHTLTTAVVVLDAATGRFDTHVDVHRLRVRQLSEAQLADYVARDKPLDCAGSYKIESLGIALMESIVGEDFTAITGLPLVAVSQLLENNGIPIFRVDG